MGIQIQFHNLYIGGKKKKKGIEILGKFKTFTLRGD